MSSDTGITWDDQGQPLSTRYGDVYFSKDNGLAESRYVFLNHNQLPERFAALPSNGHCVIGETGFGTGLNFLACWQLWQQQAPSTAHLTYISVERFPLPQAVMAQALGLWPELAELAQLLLAQWQLTYPGDQRQLLYTLTFQQVRLVLIIDDAATGLTQLLGANHPDFYQPLWGGVDAWLLDGFAPAKNPDMWTPALFTTLSRLSHANTTFATFTAAGVVKRGLEAVGFTVEKVPGYGRKREMLKGRWRQLPVADAAPGETPWHRCRHYQPLATGKSVAVIGGGLAGCHTAYALAQRGFTVTLIERQPQLAAAASGNPQGVVYGKLSPQPQMLSDINLVGLLTSLPLYQQFWQAHPEAGAACGLLQLSYTGSLAAHHQQLAQQFSTSELLRWVSAAEASALAGHHLHHPGLFFPGSGWINPPALCRWLVNRPGIEVVANTQVTALTQHADGWQITTDTGHWQHLFTAVVIATANDARQLTPTQWLPLKPVRGQVSYVPPPPQWPPLKTVICTEGYVAPATLIDQQPLLTIGASFNLHSQNPALDPDDHRENIARIARYLPDANLSETNFPTTNLPGTKAASTVAGRVSFRSTTPDYLPLAGPVPSLSAFEQRYQDLARNARRAINSAGDYLPGLYVNVGLGSRGLIYAPLTAAVITSHIAGDPLPCSQHLANYLNPARFIIRDIKRRQ